MRRGVERLGSATFVVVFALAGVACSRADSSGEPSTSTNSESAEAPASSTIGTRTQGTACDYSPGEPLIDADSVAVDRIGGINGVAVKAAVYPHPEYEEELWSQWGQGIALEDGRFFSAIGDHLGVDGNSYLYEYDPESSRLSLVGDILSHIDHVPGTWGYGKIHSQMVPGPCGEVYFSTYWGTYRDIEFDGNYSGDILFRLNTSERTMSALDVPIQNHGQASLASYPALGLVYGEAIDPVLKNEDIDEGPFFVYDVTSEAVIHTGPPQPHGGFRAILVDREGRAFYSIGEGRMVAYDPMAATSSAHHAELPGEYLRAVTEVASDGSVYGVTENPNVFFVMRQDGSIDELGQAIGYTTSIALSPDGSGFYYMPGAHGNANEWGAPLVRVDTTTGEQSVVAELNELVEQSLGYTIGGTYNIAISPDGTMIFIGVNVGPVGDDETFGEVVLLVLELP